VNEKANLAQSDAPDAVSARKRLQPVHDQLLPDAKLPFAFRSGSAFNLEADRKKAPK
jgi:hypothetical protein